MNRYYLTHTDQDGERHQLPGTWEADTPEAAIAQMLTEAREQDDGRWEAWGIENCRALAAHTKAISEPKS